MLRPLIADCGHGDLAFAAVPQAFPASCRVSAHTSPGVCHVRGRFRETSSQRGASAGGMTEHLPS